MRNDGYKLFLKEFKDMDFATMYCDTNDGKCILAVADKSKRNIYNIYKCISEPGQNSAFFYGCHPFEENEVSIELISSQIKLQLRGSNYFIMIASKTE